MITQGILQLKLFKSKSKIKIAIYFPVVFTGLLEVACCVHCTVAILHRKTPCWYKARTILHGLGSGNLNKGEGIWSTHYWYSVTYMYKTFYNWMQVCIGYQQKEHANRHAVFTVFLVQQWTPEKISGRNVYCFATNQMRDETAKD